MEFSVHHEPEEGTDVIIGYDRKGDSFQLHGSSVPILNFPYGFDSEQPILPLSKNLIQNSVKFLKGVTFPIYCNIFHEKIQKIDYEMRKCERCGAYLSESDFKCRFCEQSDVETCFTKIENNEKDKCDPLFLFITIGNLSEDFYKNMEMFKYRFILMCYDKKGFTVLQKMGKRIGFLSLLDAEIPPNSIFKMHDGLKIPHFPISDKNGFKMDSIFKKLKPLISSIDQFLNIVIVSNVSHTCLTNNFDIPNASLSILSSNTTRCACCDVCYKTNGFYFPYSENLSIPGLCEVYSSSIRFGKKYIQLNDHSLLIHGFHLIFDQMPVFSISESMPVQIIIKTNSYVYCFTTTFKSKPGLKSFLYESSLPNMLTAFGANKESLKSLILQSMTKETITIPYSLRYFMYFPTISNRRTINSVLSMRPFVVQFLPSLKIPEFVSQSLFSNISLLLILYESTLYIYIGNDVKKETWEKELGVIPSSFNESFELKGISNDFQSDLWKTIRSIKRMYEPYEIPIIVVPNESGRRVQLYEALSCDIVNGNNLIYQRYADLIHSKL